MNLARLTAQLVRHEGLRLKPYRDTVGKLTIGVGRNLDDRGISRPEAYLLCSNDILLATHEVNMAFPWAADLPDRRLEVLVNMCFNLGLPGISEFKKMLAAAAAGDHEAVAKEMKDSRWARQVGRRADELIEQWRTG